MLHHGRDPARKNADKRGKGYALLQCKLAGMRLSIVSSPVNGGFVYAHRSNLPAGTAGTIPNIGLPSVVNEGNATKHIYGFGRVS